MVTNISDAESFQGIIAQERAVLFYFSTQSCSVGEALEPKVRELLTESFPRIHYCWADMSTVVELCASQQVFVEPTILLFVDGKETLRRSRHISIAELGLSLGRIYGLVFGG